MKCLCCCFCSLCRFVDRDGDGYITADDIFTLQAMLMQRSEVFLRVSADRDVPRVQLLIHSHGSDNSDFSGLFRQ